MCPTLGFKYNFNIPISNGMKPRIGSKNYSIFFQHCDGCYKNNAIFAALIDSCKLVITN